MLDITKHTDWSKRQINILLVPIQCPRCLEPDLPLHDPSQPGNTECPDKSCLVGALSPHCYKSLSLQASWQSWVLTIYWPFSFLHCVPCMSWAFLSELLSLNLSKTAESNHSFLRINSLTFEFLSLGEALRMLMWLCDQFAINENVQIFT